MTKTELKKVKKTITGLTNVNKLNGSLNKGN